MRNVGKSGCRESGSKYSEIPNNGIEILGRDLVTVYFALEQGAPRFVVRVLAHVAHVVYRLDAKERQRIR